MSAARALLLKVPKPVVDARIDRFLEKNSPLTAERIAYLLKTGGVKIRGKAVNPARKLWGGEEVEVLVPPPRTLPRMDGPNIPVLMENDRFIAIDKPSGITVEPERDQLSIVELLATQRKGFDVAGYAAPGVAHRLDKDTSGCLIFAKTDEAAAALKAAFEKKAVDKRYLAIVTGTPAKTATLEGPYGRSLEDPRRYTTKVKSARRARLTFEVVEQFKDAALLDVVLDTGRTHQIRVQLAEAGHGVLGDLLYGRASPLIQRFALHARLLEIPSLGVSVRAEPPADFEAVLQTLRQH